MHALQRTNQQLHELTAQKSFTAYRLVHEGMPAALLIDSLGRTGPREIGFPH